MEKIKRAANKNEWEMTPSTVNAYYTATKNTMGIIKLITIYHCQFTK